MKKIIISMLIISVLYSCTAPKYVVTPVVMTSKDGTITFKKNGITTALPDTTMPVYLIHRRQ